MDPVEIRASDLLDTLQIGVVVHSCDTAVLYANPKALELLGISKDQAFGRTGFDPEWCFLDQHGNKMAVEDYPVNQVLRRKYPIKDLQAGIRDSSGGMTWVNCQAYPEFDADGKIIRIIVNFLDITVRKNREEEIKAANQKLHRQNLELKEINEQKNKILGIVAHDLRNPLYALTTAFQLVGEFVDDNDPELFEIIDCSIKSMNAIIEDLFESQALQTAEISTSKEPHLLNELIHEVSKMNLQNAKKKSIRIQTKMPESIRASFDYVKLQRALDNLLSNAIKFSPAQSEVTIGCDIIDPDRLRIYVHDHGPGLTDEDKGKVFQPFQRLSAQPTNGEPSSGLGLSIVKKIAELHGGDAGVMSEYLKGARFYLDLPR